MLPIAYLFPHQVGMGTTVPMDVERQKPKMGEWNGGKDSGHFRNGYCVTEKWLSRFLANVTTLGPDQQ